MALIPDYPLLENPDGNTLFVVDNGIATFSMKASDFIAFMALSVERPGVVKDFAGPKENIPPGYLYCDGSAVSRTTYAALFAAIGTSHGAGDGSTTFNLPDRRGVFVRGMADGSTRDPDRATRTASAPGGNSGDAVGSRQGHAFQTHTHIQNPHSHRHMINGHIAAGPATPNSPNNTAWTSGGIENTTATNQNAAASGVTAQASANETRPINVNTVYMIKY